MFEAARLSWPCLAAFFRFLRARFARQEGHAMDAPARARPRCLPRRVPPPVACPLRRAEPLSTAPYVNRTLAAASQRGIKRGF